MSVERCHTFVAESLVQYYVLLLNNFVWCEPDNKQNNADVAYFISNENITPNASELLVM